MQICGIAAEMLYDQITTESDLASCLSPQQDSGHLYFLVSRASESIPTWCMEMFWPRGVMPQPKER